MNYTICKHCDHFVEPNFEDTTKFLHLEDGEQEFDHNAEPSQQSMKLKEWTEIRPDLFIFHKDERVGPNSKFHHRRGKNDN